MQPQTTLHNKLYQAGEREREGKNDNVCLHTQDSQCIKLVQIKNKRNKKEKKMYIREPNEPEVLFSLHQPTLRNSVSTTGGVSTLMVEVSTPLASNIWASVGTMPSCGENFFFPNSFQGGTEGPLYSPVLPQRLSFSSSRNGKSWLNSLFSSFFLFLFLFCLFVIKKLGKK